MAVRVLIDINIMFVDQRDERLGWMGDAAISAEEASYNFPGLNGIVGTHSQFVDMIADEQGDDGAVSDITPTLWQLGKMQPGDPNWGSAFPTIAHQVWVTTGKVDIIERYLERLVHYLHSLQAQVKQGLDHIITHYGDCE
jgi:alpha-L-rhamnosidase